MNEEELKRLLEKYYKGESTYEEELRLRNFFSGENIPEGYDTERIIFSHYITFADIPAPSHDFESRILAGIATSENAQISVKIRRYILPILSAAAGLLILAGSYFFFIHKSESEDTFKDPRIAYAETIKILMGVSSRLNHTARALEPVSKMNEMTEKSFSALSRSALIVGKSLRSLDQLENVSDTRNDSSSKNKNINNQ